MLTSTFGKSRWKSRGGLVYVSSYEKPFKKHPRRFVLKSVFTNSQITCYFSSPQQAIKEGYRRIR